MFWIGLVVSLLVAAFVAIALAPKPVQPKPAALEDFEVPTAEQGRPVPVVFGTVTVRGPNMLWYGDLKAEPIYSEGGKK